MAKSKRKRELAARNAKDARKLTRVVIIGTLIMMFLMYLMFRNS